LLAAQHVHFGEVAEQLFWREERGEEVVGLEIGFVLGADVEEDHGAEEFGREDAVVEVGYHAGHLHVRAQRAWLRYW